MDGFLSPSVEQVIPFLAQTCDELTKQVLIRELTRYTEELCKGDPDLADTILEGRKTLQGCVRYVLEAAAKVVVKNIEAMTEAEFNALGKKQVRGKNASMAGAAVGSEDALKWAQEYYYKAPEERTSKTTEEKKSAGKKQKSGKKTSGTATTATSSSAPAADSTAKGKDKNAMTGGTQISMAGFAAPASGESAA